MNQDRENNDSDSKNVTTGALVALGILFLVLIYLVIKLYLLQKSGGAVLNFDTSSFGLLPIFLTGLITGGLTCLAVQGGLLASTIAQQGEERLTEQGKKSGNALPIVVFLIAKLIAYTLLGFLLGWFGSLFTLSLTAQVIMQLAVIVFMLGTALNILDVHPIFRYFALQPPRFITRRIKDQSRSKSIFAPAILGAFTVFIPCGTTQAMMALAVASGKPVLGASILFAFILGTTPLFFILGYFATKLGDTFQRKFMRIAAIALILLAIFNLRNTLGLAGINISIGFGQNDSSLVTETPTIEFTPNGYTPKSLSVKAGSNVTLNLKNINGGGCIQSFVIPKYGIQKVVRQGTTEQISFTAPAEKGQIAFMCGMGMYRGIINVI